MDISEFNKEQTDYLMKKWDNRIKTQNRKKRCITMWKAIKRLVRSLFNRAKEEVREAEEKASEKIDEASEDVEK